MTEAEPFFAEQFQENEEFNAIACLNCGVCTAVCPLGIELLPRQLFRYVLLGVKDKVIEEKQTIFSCLLCRLCEENCPEKVHIAGNVRLLRTFINKEVYGLK